MRKSLVSIGVAAVLLSLTATRAHAACECPPASLEERIAGAVYIFSGKPLMFAQIPPGNSPFHSESSIEVPGGVPNDIVTMFQVDRVWKGEALRRIMVRRSPAACAANFQLDETVIVFAQSDRSGVLWTSACSGDAVKGDDRYEALISDLTDRLNYN